MKDLTKILIFAWLVVLPLGILLDIQHTLVAESNALSDEYYITTTTIEVFCFSIGLLIGNYMRGKW